MSRTCIEAALILDFVYVKFHKSISILVWKSFGKADQVDLGGAEREGNLRVGGGDVLREFKGF